MCLAADKENNVSSGALMLLRDVHHAYAKNGHNGHISVAHVAKVLSTNYNTCNTYSVQIQHC